MKPTSATIRHSIAVIAAASSFWVTSAFADITPYLPKKTLVEIGEYDPSIAMFSISSRQYHGYGKFFVTIDELVKAIPSLKADRIRQHPNSIVSNEYQLDQDIDVIDLVSESNKSRSPASAP